MAKAYTQRRPLRIGVLLSGAGSSFENLHARIASDRIPARIVVVIASRADAGGLARARRLGVPAVAIPRKQNPRLTTRAYNDLLHAALAKHEADLAALLGFLWLFEPRAAYAGRAINVHPALIPAFSGKGMYGHHVHQAVLAAGAAESGATVHIVDDEYDHGPVLLQRRVPVLAGDTVQTLQARVQAVEREMVPAVVRDFAEGRLAFPYAAG